MHEPAYAVHDRIAIRRAAAPEGTRQRQTVDLYAHLLGHILQAYGESGPLRSMALRKLSESLNDILDHDQLVQAYRQRTQQQRGTPQQWAGGATGYQVPPGGLTH
ncbi:hypothetical protein [Streptomyces sp. 5-10]|uniref:hypothetical protein n=1 Tax=Streptomyces sp. 5-10 TaxID=878925 RepID=UPI00168BCC97|nr:hypothetical protein [Streptomyces sp. 5-10]MBD3004544.1 hypothetical protein [Streptomyces sp. 5-10]